MNLGWGVVNVLRSLRLSQLAAQCTEYRLTLYTGHYVEMYCAVQPSEDRTN